MKALFQWPAPLVHLLNATTKMRFEILFVMLVGAIVFPFSFGIQCLHENEKTRKVFWELYSADVMRGTGYYS